MDGKNVADFIDPEIEAKLDALEREEERLIAQGFYDSDDGIEDEEVAAINVAALALKQKKEIIVNNHRANKGKARPIPKKTQARVSGYIAMIR